MKIGIFTDSHYSSADTTGRLTMRGEKSSIICSRPTRNTSLTLFGSAIRSRLALRLPYLKAVTPYGLISVGGRRLDRSPYIEEVLGFHTVNAFERVVEWQKPDEFKNAVGIKNLRFANVVTDILARGNACTVRSNGHFTLEINGRAFQISPGEQAITL